MAPISHILYDLGNTLLHFHGEWAVVFGSALKAAADAAQAAGVPVQKEVLVRSLRADLEAYYAQRDLDLIEITSRKILLDCLVRLGVSNPDERQLLAILGAFYAVTQDSWHPVPDAAQTLAALQQDGYRQGVLSNAANDADVQQLVDRAGLRSHLDFVLTSATLGIRKPHPAAFSAALEAWQVAPDRVLMVGDTLAADIAGAQAAGIRSLWLQQNARPQPESRFVPDYELQHLRELPRFLARVNAAGKSGDSAPS